MSAANTHAPSSAARNENALPRPDPAPVTITALPLSIMQTSLSPRVDGKLKSEEARAVVPYLYRASTQLYCFL
jgi:hypothetical protein